MREQTPAFASASTPRGRTGVLTYEPYYGLTEKPFSLSTEPRLLYKSESHARVFEDLLLAIQRREGLVVLTGEIGAGKTTLCRSVLAHLDRKTFTTFVPDPFVTREDLLKMLLVEFGVVSVDDLVRGRLKGASRPDLSYPLYEFLESLEPIDAFAVLIIDEAQNLPLPLLEEIRILSDLERGRKLLQVVLIGQPELRDDLKLPRMRQVEQRVSMHCELRPLTRDGVAGYVAHRLAMAGATTDRVCFTPAGLDVVHEATGGVPRVVNLLCDRALYHGHLEGTSQIGPDLVAAAMADLRMVRPASVAEASVAGVALPAPVSAPLRAPRAAVAVGPGGPSEMEALLGMPPTPTKVIERVPLSAPSSTAFPRATTRRAAAPPPAPTRDGSSSGRRVPALAVLALTALGVLAGASLAVYGLWMRPILRERVALPPLPVVQQAPSPVSVAPQELVALPVIPSASPSPIPSPTTAASASGWALQVGAFASPARAHALEARLSQGGFTTIESAPVATSRGPLHVVLAGPYPTSDAAEAARAQLRQQPGFEGALIRRLNK